MDKIIEDILLDILRELRLLTIGMKSEALLNFRKDFLITKQREIIYDSIDGVNDLKDIARKACCSDRSVQLFIKELFEKDLINTSKQSNRTIPEQSIDKIAFYYANYYMKKGGYETSE